LRLATQAGTESPSIFRSHISSATTIPNPVTEQQSVFFALASTAICNPATEQQSFSTHIPGDNKGST
jgi:hypothetical protein